MLDLYTPEQVAELLHVTPEFVKKKCRAKQMGCIKLSRKNIIIKKNHIEEYLEANEWQRETKANMRPIEKTVDGGESLNISTEADIGMLAASLPREKLKPRSPCSKSKNVVPISRLGKS